MALLMASFMALAHCFCSGTRSSQDDGFAFMPQLGVGLRYMLTEGSSLELEWRYHHISNAGTHPPNHGINTNLLSIGTSIFF